MVFVLAASRSMPLARDSCPNNHHINHTVVSLIFTSTGTLMLEQMRSNHIVILLTVGRVQVHSPRGGVWQAPLGVYI